LLADAPDTVAAGSLLLLIGGSEDRARGLETALRQSGFAARAAWIADLEELDEALRRGGADLIVCAAETGSRASLAAVLAVCSSVAPELPVLELGATHDLAATNLALRLGARDRICAGTEADFHHLCHVVRRESSRLRSERELIQARTRMAAFETRHRERLDDISDAVIHVQDGVVSRANHAFAALLQKPADLLVGSSLMDLVAPDQQPRIKDQLRQLARGKASDGPLPTVLLRADGQPVAVDVHLTQGTVGRQSFVEWLIRVEAEAATTEPAGDAGSRVAADASAGALQDRLALFRALAQPAADARPRAVMLFIADGFASLEARVGLEDAELLMTQVAAAIQTRIGAPPATGSTVAPVAAAALYRFSTDEWVAVVSRATAAEFEALADRLCRELAQQVFTAGTHETRVSLTVAAYPIGASEAATQAIDPLVREARRASAEGGGRALVTGPTAQAQADARENARRAAQLKRALDHDRMHLAYQSIASLEGEARQHFDVLVRMVDESGQERHAGEFIDAAVQFGLMRAVDRWVLGQAIKVLAKRERSDEPPVLFVKISEDSLRDTERLLATLREQLATHPLRQRELCLAVQELSVQNHLRKTLALAQALEQLGVGLAIEHFGIGTHSSALLEQLPARFVKFHASYTRNFSDAATQRKMADLLSITRRRGIRTIASHVEDANVMARMWQLGINYIQGYHVQEPEAVLLSTTPIRGN